MNLDKSKKIFWIAASVISFILILFVIFFIILMIYFPDVVPPSETYWSFWIKNFSLLIAALTFTTSAFTVAYNGLEQRHLRYMENYPFLEVFPVLSVDPLPLPVPKFDLPPELYEFNTGYLKTYAPEHPRPTSDTEFRYLALVLRNVGHGTITKVTINGTAEVPVVGNGTSFMIERRFYLYADQTMVFTILPIAGLPGYKIKLTSLEYTGYFVTLKDFDGKHEFQDNHPYKIPPEQRITIFNDDFNNIPAGLGWVMDFWGSWQATEYCMVPPPSGDNHYLLLKGDKEFFSKIPNHNPLVLQRKVVKRQAE